MNENLDHQRLDGNAVSGLLQEVFSFELTKARTVCAHCSAVAHVAELHVYVDAPGTVVRCRACEQVQLRVVQDQARLWLELRGVRCLEIDERP